MFKVCVDPGHAGRKTDPGAVNPVTGLKESDVNLMVAQRLEEYLKKAGCAVLLTRTKWDQPETHDLSYRTKLSNSWGANAFVSLHCNSATSSAAKGYEVWTSPGQTKGDRLATLIFKQIAGEFPDRKGRTDTSDGDPDKEARFYVLTHTVAPACLVEMAFISNMEEEKLLANPKWRERMAQAIARGVTDFAAHGHEPA